MRLATRAPQEPNPLPMMLKQRIMWSYTIPKVYGKASKRSVVDMAYRPTSKVIALLKTSWFPPRTRTHGK